MDAMNLEYPEDTFAAIIDKSTIDALLCGNDSYLNVAKMLKVINIKKSKILKFNQN